MAQKENPRGRRKLPAAVELGHRGGLKGGPARAAKLSSVERSKIASMGGRAKARRKKDPK